MRNLILLTALALCYLLDTGTVEAKAWETKHGALFMCGDGIHDKVTGQSTPVTEDQKDAIHRNAARDSLRPFDCAYQTAIDDEFIVGLRCKKGPDTALSILGKSDEYPFVSKSQSYAIAVALVYKEALEQGFRGDQCRVMVNFKANE